MDNRTLESFLMVVDNGSIAEAARRLNITPAGVAQRIRALETDVGTRLIMRSGQRVRPTEAGRAILAHARSILEEMRDLKSIAVHDEPSGQLRLGATGSSTSGLLPGVLTLMAARFPQIEIYMLSGNGADLYHIRRCSTANSMPPSSRSLHLQSRRPTNGSPRQQSHQHGGADRVAAAQQADFDRCIRLSDGAGRSRSVPSRGRSNCDPLRLRPHRA
jgi:DNA-binding transcriptional LysR family regulator